MSVSRGGCLFKVIQNGIKKQMVGQFNQVRNSSGPVTYRRGVLHLQTPGMMFATNCINGIFWWWVFWHFWHDSGHIVGEFDYPDPTKWTNAELGIPPDDEE